MHVEVHDRQYAACPQEVLGAAATETLVLAGRDLDRLSIVLVDDEQMAALNSRYRHRDGPTDVISFEAEAEGDELVGEVIVSLDTAMRQAGAAGHGIEVELAWLVSHGVLHVLGMDDETQEQLDLMLALQRAALKRMGLAIHL